MSIYRKLVLYQILKDSFNYFLSCPVQRIQKYSDLCPVREIENTCSVLKIQDRTGIADPWMPQHFPGVLGSSFAYSQLSAIIQFQISCAVQNGID